MPGLIVRVFIFFWLLLSALPGRSLAKENSYQVDFSGLSAELTTTLSSVSDCVTLRGTPPETMGLLATRMRNDLKAFTRALDALGYFKARVAGDVNQDASPPIVRFRIDPGPRFVLGQSEVRFFPANPELQRPARQILDMLKPGTKYAAGLILDVETALLDEPRRRGYPTPSMARRSVIADHATNTVNVVFTMDTGPAAAFGQTVFDGLERVTRDHVLGRVAWQTGRPFDQRLIDRTREDLIRTGLFRSVTVETDRVESGRVDMLVHVLEAPHHAVRTGLWHYSDLGLGGSAGWTHRNLFGSGQKFDVEAKISENQQSTIASLTMPDMWHPDQSLGLAATWDHERTDVYASRRLALSAILTRTFAKFRLSQGLAYRRDDVDEDGARQFNLVSIPLGADLSTVDTPLDPTSGFTLASRLEPFKAIGGRSSSFILWSISGSHFLELAAPGKLILATRGRYSVLAGTGRESVPEDLLLYAGGGGSVRGYAYQYAGQLDEDDEPEGGLSSVDLTAELRWRMAKDFGAVLFGDGGRSFTDRNPGRLADYFWAVGTGLRYYTPIGPIRLDVAMPLDRRDGVDAPFQVYVSLGQAF